MKKKIHNGMIIYISLMLSLFIAFLFEEIGHYAVYIGVPIVSYISLLLKDVFETYDPIK